MVSIENQLPIEVLHISVKWTFEADSNSLRQCLDRAFSSEEVSQIIKRNVSNGPVHNQMIYLLGLHGLMRERLQYGRYGWNFHYDFNETDLIFGLSALEAMINRPHGIKSFAEVWSIIRDVSWGGRVHDSWDLRCMEVLSERFYSMFASVADEPPECEPMKIVQDLITKIEAFDHQSRDQEMIRKLHENQYFLSTLRQSQDGEAAACEITDEERSHKTVSNVIAHINEKLPNRIPSTPIDVDPCPLQMILYREIDLVNNLISVVKDTLDKLMRSLTNATVSTGELPELFSGITPGGWCPDGFIKIKPLEIWLDHINNRAEFLINWNINGPPNRIFLDNLSLPRAFLIAVKQIYARHRRISLIDIDFQYEVADINPIEYDATSTSANLLDGLTLQGLLIDAAVWDSENQWLCEALSGPLISQFPLMKMIPGQNRYQNSKNEMKVCNILIKKIIFISLKYSIQGPIISECLQQTTHEK